MKIKIIKGKINKIVDLSKTAKEVEIKLSEPLDFSAGAFVNLFINIDGQKIRRAYSIASSPEEKDIIKIAMRLTPNGKMSTLFWTKDMTGEELEIMGPLGLNTVDKMNRKKVYLFGFGIGAGVTKGLVEYFKDMLDLEKLTIFTGSKFENEVLYKDYFENLTHQNNKIEFNFTVSRPEENSNCTKGYIQDHIGKYDFNNSDIYICGQESACNELVAKIKSLNPIDYDLFVEGFH
ncbi:FAD-dependent oxidoreductase [Candidatus Nomurabacteria bacterium]|nr:MAG: FAD-dependent oxidoreductase [Candidatus Nomurabacteria bacterium]